MRLGIADPESWLAAIEPRVIDAWLAFARVEPEAFGLETRSVSEGSDAWTPSGKPIRWMDPAEALRVLGERFG